MYLKIKERSGTLLKLKTLLYTIPKYQLIHVTYNHKNAPVIQESAIKADLMKEPYVANYNVTSVYSSQNILRIYCEERRKRDKCTPNI